MVRLIVYNMMWNAAFVAMMLSELSGFTAYHEALPPSLKWIWGCALAAGNLAIHVMMLRRVFAVKKMFTDRRYLDAVHGL